MSARRSSHSKPAAATAADPIQIDSGTDTPEPSTPPLNTDAAKVDQQLESSIDVSAATEPASADTPATPADTPSEAPDEPEEKETNDNDNIATSSGVKDDQAEESLGQPEPEIPKPSKKDEEVPATVDDEKPTVGGVTEGTPTPTALEDEVTAGIKRPEPDSKDEADKESRDYLEGAYKSPFRHAAPLATKSQESQPQESS